ncbi:MAG TPA: VWA domain-containing protein [Methanocella sp.]|nr:VWA domain-containing protein [Methanocella sp.]
MVEKGELERWRLILGSDAREALEKQAGDGCQLSLGPDMDAMDQALAAIYDGEAFSYETAPGGRSAGRGPSAPSLAKWLGDVRRCFPQDVVSVIQADAIERKGLTSLLFEPETLQNVKPDIKMVATLLSLKNQIPERTKETARELVRAVVDEIKKKMETEIRMSVTGAMNRREHSPIPSLPGIDWKRTIARNLKNYDPDRKIITPERFYYFGRSRRFNNWTIILDMDQSGSMAESIIYGSVIGSILASLPALDTRVVVFDTNVVDLTEQCHDDPVDMLFGIQLGGGTDIEKSVNYCRQFISEPKKTMFILLSDLYEGGNRAGLVQKLDEMNKAGVKVICMLALSDDGAPSYDRQLAEKLSKLGIPCFACTPGLLPEFLEGALKGHDLQALAKKGSGKA